jgi:hypothetical protein
MRTLSVVVLLLASSALLPAALHAKGFDGLSCLEFAATIVADGPGVVHGTGGRDVIYADDFVEQTIRSYGGDDVICAGNLDTVYAGSGDDTVLAIDSVAAFGESGNDNLRGSEAGLISGGSGNDRLEGDQDLLGGAGNDLFVAFSGFTGTCDGGSGVDSFEAGSGPADCASVASIP